MHKTNWIHIGLCTGLLLTGSAALAQPDTPQPGKTEGANASDQEFLNRALRLNELELRLGQLASERGSTPDFKAKGKAMVEKHTDFGRQLAEQGRRSGVAKTPALTTEQQALVTRIEGLSGAEFDAAFTQTIDEIHRQELAMYQDEATRAVDPQLRTLAEKRVTTLQKTLAKPTAQPPAQPKTK